MKIPIVCLLLICTAIACTSTESKEKPTTDVEKTPPATNDVMLDLDTLFDDIGAATFVLLDDASGQMQVYNPALAEVSLPPASTFKIPNSLIALETGVATGADFTLSRDTVLVPSQSWWPKSWYGEQTLHSALQNSVVWYYQELARRTGAERMSGYLEQFDYGNMDISGGIDQFWLRGGLRISPMEQVRFLQRFYHNQLGVSQHNTDIVKQIMLLDTTSGYRLGGKTGTANASDSVQMGWLVGYLERGDELYFYALNMQGPTIWDEWPPHKRVGLLKHILRTIQILP